MELADSSSIGRPGRRLMDAVKEDMKLVEAREEGAEQRVEWRYRQLVVVSLEGISPKEKKKVGSVSTANSFVHNT